MFLSGYSNHAVISFILYDSYPMALVSFYISDTYGGFEALKKLEQISVARIVHVNVQVHDIKIFPMASDLITYVHRLVYFAFD